MKDLFNQHQRFSLRKYSVGLASVLLGVALIFGGQVASADENASTASTPGTSITSSTENGDDIGGFPEIPTPVNPGYYANKKDTPFVEVDPGAGEVHLEETVLYRELGKIKLVDQNSGTTIVEKTYENDQTDATRADQTEVPELPKGYEYVDGRTAQKDGVIEHMAYKNKGLADDPSTPDIDESLDSDIIVKSTTNTTVPLTEENGKIVFTPTNDVISDKDPDDASYGQGNNVIFYIKEILDNVTLSTKQTVTFEGAGDKTPATNEQSDYTFTGKKGQATGKTTWDETSHTYGKVDVPVITGYYADKKEAGEKVVTPENPEVTDKVVYKELGKIIPVDPDGNQIPNVPTPTYNNDPKDPTKGGETPVPEVPGYTPDVPTVTPEDPGKDTPVIYRKDEQKAIIKYINQNGNVELAKDEVAGKSGEAINYSTTDRINELKRKGYELVSDGFTKDGGQSFDFDAKVDQEFTVTLKERIEPVDPDKPTPDPETPVTPEDPNTPTWPDTVKDIENKDSVTRTVKYVYEDGSQASADVSETLNFKRFAYVNLVTGAVEYREWTTNDDTFDAVTSPSIQGYTPDKAVVAEVTGVVAGTPDSTEVVTYVKDAQKAIIKYVNQNGNVELAKDEVAGKSGEAINYSTTDRINELKRKGYELVSDGFTKDGGQSFDFDAKVDQEFTVTLKERIEPVDPDQPKPDPEKPVDPKDPNTPTWPDTVKDIENKDSVTRTIKYVYEDGSQASADVAETLNFKRFAYVNLVTGAVEYREWTTNDDTFDAVTSPAIQGYTPDKAVVAEVTGVKAGAEDIVEVVTYVKDVQKAIIKYVNQNGNVELAKDEVAGKSGEAIIYSTTDRINELKRKGYELVSDGFTKDGGQSFDFDAKVDQEFTVTLKERIEPVDPDQPTPDPETPVTPEDPNTPNWPDTVKDIENKDAVTRTIKYVYEDGSKAADDASETLNFKRFAYVNLVTGAVEYRDWTTNDDTFDAVTSPAIQGYTPDKAVVAEVTGVVAGTPDSTEVVTYVKDVAQKATVTYIDETTGKPLEVVNLSGKSGEAVGYSTADRITYYTNRGYELVSDGYPADATYDLDASVDQAWTVTLKHGTAPVGPNDPHDPNTPINPDPDGPKWPAKDAYLKDVTSTVKYLGAGDKTPADNVQTAQWSRTLTIDKVTGEVLKATDWASNKASYDAVATPVVQGYYADKASVASKTVTQDNLEETVTYKPLGSLVPKSDDPNFPDTPTVPYPNDPTDPTKPGQPIVPDVPGYKPYLPDPNDPSKPGQPIEPGTPITPENPGEDTPIIYVPITPDTPVTPEKPEPKPEKPVTPEKPEPKPEKPVTPEKPVDPVVPVTPEKPTDPAKPVEPTKPVEPSRPSEPANETPEAPAQKLPETGEQSSAVAVALGALLGTLGFGLSRKKKED